MVVNKKTTVITGLNSSLINVLCINEYFQMVPYRLKSHHQITLIQLLRQVVLKKTYTADCSPSCTTTWTGPNLPAGSTSILNLNSIVRSQAGAYNCTAVNEISSLTLIKVNVIVNCKYEMSMVY